MCTLNRLKAAINDAKLDVKEHIENINDDINDQIENVITNIKDSLMTKEMQEAVETVQFVLERLKEFDKEAKQYDGYGFLLLALVKKAQLSQVNSPVIEPRTTRSIHHQLDNAKRFGQYAVQMYPLSWISNLDSIAKSLGVSPEGILMVHFTDEADGGHCPKFILFLDHQVESIVLSIRGTFCLKDAILDAVADEESFLHGKAHKGILHGAQKILSKVLDTIKENIHQYPSYSLTITGHSLGAGTAELITMEIMSIPGLIPDTTKVQCIALAPPPVFRSQTEIPSKISSAINIYVNNYDCVPRLSLASVARLLAAVRAVDDLGLSLTEQLAILTDRCEDTDKIEKINEVVAKVHQDRFPDLDHPGTVYHIQKSDENQKPVILLSKSKIFTQSILLLENMILDHLHTSYENVLHNI